MKIKELYEVCKNLVNEGKGNGDIVIHTVVDMDYFDELDTGLHEFRFRPEDGAYELENDNLTIYCNEEDSTL